MVHLYIIRGLPGVGKTTLGKAMAANVFAADDYFTKEDGSYHYDPMRIAEAHEDCLKRCEEKLLALLRNPDLSSQFDRSVAVTNVFQKHQHFVPYVVLAQRLQVRYWVMDLFDQGCGDEVLAKATVHGVPVEKYDMFRSGWEF
jgi:hypothetical protein